MGGGSEEGQRRIRMKQGGGVGSREGSYWKVGGRVERRVGRRY